MPEGKPSVTAAYESPAHWLGFFLVRRIEATCQALAALSTLPPATGQENGSPDNQAYGFQPITIESISQLLRHIERVMDPVGAEVGVSAPPPPPDPAAPSPTSLGSVGNFGTGCYVDGVESPCSIALGYVNAGIATASAIYAPGGLGSLLNSGITPYVSVEWQAGQHGDRGELRPVWRFQLHHFMGANNETANTGEGEPPNTSPVPAQSADPCAGRKGLLRYPFAGPAHRRVGVVGTHISDRQSA